MVRFIKATTAFMAGVLALADIPSAQGQQRSVDDRPKITVTGESVVYVQPDKILISLGIETWDGHMDAAKRKNDEIVQKTIAAIEECGIEKKAIQMDHLAIQPTYDTRAVSWPRVIDGYSVRNAMVVTLTDVALLDRLIAAALKAGANHVHSVDFQTTELRKYRDQARRLALKAAREKAIDMAAALDQTVGKPLQISESTLYGGSFCHYWSWCGWGSCWYSWGGGRDYGMSQNVAVNAPSGSGEGVVIDQDPLPGTALEPGGACRLALGRPAAEIHP